MRVMIKGKRLSPGETWGMAAATLVALGLGWVVGMVIMANLIG